MSSNIFDRKPPSADVRLQYGPGEFQFGDLWRPPGSGKPAAVVVFVHGGWWKAARGLEYGGHLCADLRAHGIACWSLEYRRVGNEGGGWPGTFEDVADGFDFLSLLGRERNLDLHRVVVVGHSAGGHLAFWLAGRIHLPEHGALPVRTVKTPLRGAISLAGAVDLRVLIELAEGVYAHDRDEVTALMGGLPAEFPERYRAGDPGELVPFNIPQILFQGTNDAQMPPGLPARWAERGRRLGDEVDVHMLPGADHLDVVDPLSGAWAQVRQTVHHLLRPKETHAV